MTLTSKIHHKTNRNTRTNKNIKIHTRNRNIKRFTHKSGGSFFSKTLKPPKTISDRAFLQKLNSIETRMVQEPEYETSMIIAINNGDTDQIKKIIKQPTKTDIFYINLCNLINRNFNKYNTNGDKMLLKNMLYIIEYFNNYEDYFNIKQFISFYEGILNTEEIQEAVDQIKISLEKKIDKMPNEPGKIPEYINIITSNDNEIKKLYSINDPQIKDNDAEILIQTIVEGRIFIKKIREQNYKSMKVNEIINEFIKDDPKDIILWYVNTNPSPADNDTNNNKYFNNLIKFIDLNNKLFTNIEYSSISSSIDCLNQKRVDYEDSINYYEDKNINYVNTPKNLEFCFKKLYFIMASILYSHNSQFTQLSDVTIQSINERYKDATQRAEAIASTTYNVLFEQILGTVSVPVKPAPVKPAPVKPVPVKPVPVLVPVKPELGTRI